MGVSRGGVWRGTLQLRHGPEPGLPPGRREEAGGSGRPGLWLLSSPQVCSVPAGSAPSFKCRYGDTQQQSIRGQSVQNKRVEAFLTWQNLCLLAGNEARKPEGPRTLSGGPLSSSAGLLPK